VIAAAPAIENLTLNIIQEIHVRSSITATLAALLEQMGPANEGQNGSPMPMTLEPWPGGRWFRDLGSRDGHFWGHVQAIKRPTLLEITGPLFASSPFLSNLQYRLSEQQDGTLITFRHTALGMLSDEQRKGVSTGWLHILSRIKVRAESANSRSASVQ